MSSSYAELAAAWEAGTAFAPPLPVSTHPVLATFTLTLGLFFAASFGISQKPSIAHELATAVPGALLLGFGTVFLFLAVGLYL